MMLQITNQAIMRILAVIAVLTMVAGTLPTTASAIVIESTCINVEENLLTNPSFESDVADANAAAGGFWEVFTSISGWTSSSEDGFEVWNNMFGGASNGSQNLELDVNAPTTVSQTIATVVGNVYKLSYAFAARPGKGASDNQLEVKVAGATAANHSADGTSDTSIVWSTYSTVFTATGATTLIEFADTGTGTAGEGTLLDNTHVCLVTDNAHTSVGGQKWNDTDNDGYWDEGEYGQDGVTITITDGGEFSQTTVTGKGGSYLFDEVPTGATYTVCEEIPTGAIQTHPTTADELESMVSCGSNGNGYQLTPSGEGEYGLDFGNYEADTYEIFGYVWDDTNENDSFESDETDLEGWTVQAKNTETNEVVSDETDASGRYSLNVTVGTWVVSQVVQDGWIQLSNADGDGTYTVVIVAPVEEVFTLAFPLNLFISVAQAANVPSYVGPKNFGNDSVPQSSSGSKSKKSSNSDNSDGDTTSGGSTPTGQVLGAATSILPVGAPKTGAGSTSALPTLPTLLAILTDKVARRTK